MLKAIADFIAGLSESNQGALITGGVAVATSFLTAGLTFFSTKYMMEKQLQQAADAREHERAEEQAKRLFEIKYNAIVEMISILRDIKKEAFAIDKELPNPEFENGASTLKLFCNESTSSKLDSFASLLSESPPIELSLFLKDENDTRRIAETEALFTLREKIRQEANSLHSVLREEFKNL